jgi:hypothetical protein
MSEVTGAFSDAFETIVIWDWLHCRASSISDIFAAVKKAVFVLHGTIEKHELLECTIKLLPSVNFCISLCKGFRGYLDTAPGPVFNVSFEDVAFLSPFTKSEIGTAKCYEFTSSSELPKFFKPDDWRRIRGAFQQSAGAEPTRGKILKVCWLSLERLREILSTPAADEEVEAQSKQSGAVGELATNLKGFGQNRKGDVDALREGALEFLDDVAVQVVTCM